MIPGPFRAGGWMRPSARVEDLGRCTPWYVDLGEAVVWREPKRATLAAFYAWLLVAFLAGAIAGAAVASAFSGAPWTEQHPSGASSALTSAVHGGPVRAGRMVESRQVGAVVITAEAEGAERYPVVGLPGGGSGLEKSAGARVPSVAQAHSSDPARTTAVDDELPASEALLTVAPSRDDPALVLAAIDAAAAEFGHEAERMRVVTFCESRWDPLAVGDAGTSFGLWQFQLATWRANVHRGGFGYSDADVFDPVASSRVAAWMWANGGELLWTCAR